MFFECYGNIMAKLIRSRTRAITVRSRWYVRDALPMLDLPSSDTYDGRLTGWRWRINLSTKNFTKRIVQKSIVTRKEADVTRCSELKLILVFRIYSRQKFCLQLFLDNFSKRPACFWQQCFCGDWQFLGFRGGLCPVIYKLADLRQGIL